MRILFTKFAFRSKHTLILCLFFLFSAFSLHAQVSFRNPSPIVLPDGAVLPIAGSLYPSSIDVSGLEGIVSKVTVSFYGFEHNNPDAVDLLLVAPDGTNAIILSDVGGADDIHGIDITLDDAAPVSMPDFMTFGSGTYRPTNFGSATDTWPLPAPAPSKKSPLSTFYGINPNGTWSVFVGNDSKGNYGSIPGGWSIKITTVLAADAVRVTSFSGAYQKENKQISVNWTTESEYYVKSLTVEKAVNSSAWNSVKKIISADTSTPLPRTYEYVDSNISYGTSRYRLHIEGKDQSSKYSDEVVVQVEDDRPCSIICPSDIIIEAVPGQCGVIVNFDEPTLSGNCGTVTTSQKSGTFFPVGTTTVEVTSSNGQSSSFKITVKDMEKPVLTIPANTATFTDAGFNFATIDPGTATATDNCSGVTVSAIRSDGKELNASYPLGTTIITWTATDASGNQAAGEQTVTVTDNEKPVLTGPADITRSTDAGVSFATLDPGTATATDNCSGVTVRGSRNDGKELNASYPLGTTTITWTATDAAGNQTSAQQKVLVNDQEIPAIGTIMVSSDSLWPPNHFWHYITLNYTNTDNVGVKIVRLTAKSSEPLDSIGDGNTSEDYNVLNPTTVMLRAERSGKGNGRTYTLTVTSVDEAGNTSNKSIDVSVAHDMSSSSTTIVDAEKVLNVNVISTSTSSFFTLKVQGNASTENINMQVVDAATGALIETKSGVDPNSTLKLGSNYKRGTYHVQFTQGQEKVVVTLVK